MRCGRKYGNSLLRIVSILLVLLLGVSQLAAWPTKSEKTQQTDQTILKMQPSLVEAVEPPEQKQSQEVIQEEKQSSYQEATPPESSKTNLMMQSEELMSLLESLRKDDSSDLIDLTELRATFNEIKTLIDIQKAANKDLEEQYVSDLEAKDARIAQLEADYKALSSQYDQVVVSLASERNKKPPHNYRFTIGMSMYKDPSTGDYGVGTDLVYRIAGPFTVLGGAHYFPELGENIIYKTGVGITF